MKIIATFVLFFVSTLAEPPIDNRYLPPQQGFRGAAAAPSQTYGAPDSGFGGQRQTAALIRSRPSSTYGSPSSQRSNVRRPSTQYSAPSSQYNTPSQLYGAPASSQMGRGNGFSGFGVQSPATQYGLPSNAPSQQYGVPDVNSFGSAQTNAFEGAQSRQYLPPGRSGYAGDDGSNSEPANYNFEYMVKDDASGNDFGHRESRQGDRAEGLYYVLLPDGRKQTVEYEADQDGYKPRISYEDTGLRTGGYAGNNQGGYSSGYPGQEGPY
ncbi:unnamed protein product [Parnassius apollo]|uniref:(apollo) hypothetical protein n=1 Tax=Parnassius apollo TaxID=110799 RepID=A0A8S3WHV1_PARAO|nr:unnamed protein product [Parnassius apollo]